MVSGTTVAKWMVFSDPEQRMQWKHCRKCTDLQLMALLDRRHGESYWECKMISNDIWMQIPSGWIAARYGGKTYVR